MDEDEFQENEFEENESSEVLNPKLSAPKALMISKALEDAHDFKSLQIYCFGFFVLFFGSSVPFLRQISSHIRHIIRLRFFRLLPREFSALKVSIQPAQVFFFQFLFSKVPTFKGRRETDDENPPSKLLRFWPKIEIPDDESEEPSKYIHQIKRIF